MPHVVIQSCCADASCVVACPVNCIHPAPGEPGFATTEMLYVDPQTCVDCGACTTACPADAIVPHTTLSESQQPFAALNAEYYQVFGHADRTPLAQVPAQRRLRHPGPFRVAVVGAGPAGLYAADELLTHPEISVDVFDRLPTPYGLVRFGVAPDHPQTKQVTELFAAIESQPGFRYFLNVEVGSGAGADLTHEDLALRYHAVIYAVGASSDRALGIPGEDLPGSLSATDLVAWYNGHPEAQDLAVPLATDRAVVIGNGNVALDVARILTADPDALDGTDIAALPLEQLRRSQVREVVVLGRRGPDQAAFTVPELLGLVGLASSGQLNVVVQGPALAGDDTRVRLLRELQQRTPQPGLRTLVLRFCSAPVELLGTPESGVTAVVVEHTELVTDAAGAVVARGTGRTETLATGLVLRAVGYRARPVAGLPFDPQTARVPHHRGRVRPGLYVAGWIKRGPTGFIGTNKTDAAETVACVLDDLDALHDPSASPVLTSAEAVSALVAQRAPAYVDLAGWQEIDHDERRRGEATGRARVKLVDVEEAVRVAGRRRRARRRRGVSV